MESETSRTVRRHMQEEENWRRRCGCLRTSDKLKQILDSFPPPPPPTPATDLKPFSPIGTTCISAYCTNIHESTPAKNICKQGICNEPLYESETEVAKKESRKPWRVMSDFVQLVQLSVTATALALYYLIYCYMQLIYYTLRSALYFHNADGAMKITIGVVTFTSLVVAFNVIIKLERLIKIF